MSGLTLLARTRVLVDENGTESGGVENCFKVGPLKFTFGCSGCLLVAVALGLGLDALGRRCRFLWFCFFSVGSNHGRSLDTDPKTGSDPKITLRLKSGSFGGHSN